MTHDGAGAAAEWRSGWPVVVASALGMTLLGVGFFSAGTFIAPLEHEFGWNRAQISAAFTVSATVGVLLGAPIGMLLDKWGSRRLAIPGAALTGLSLALFSTLSGSIVQWLALWFIFAVASQLVMAMIWAAAVSRNFSASRGLALSITMMGNGATTIIAPLLANFLIEREGWRMAYLILGLGWGGLVTLVCYFMLHDRPDRPRKNASAGEQVAPATGYSVRESVRTAAFVKIFGSIFVSNLVYIALLVHLVPILSGGGLTRDTAVWITSSLGFSMMAGTLSYGLIGDRVSAKLLTAIFVAAPAITCVMLLHPTSSVLQRAIAVNLFGVAIGAQMPSFAYLWTRHFGMRSFGALQGIAGIASAAATAIGPVIAGIIFDRTGSYATLLVAGIPMLLVSGLVMLSLGRYPHFEPDTA
jgi:MFS family permease